MAELQRNEMPWLEAELLRQLAPVSAPEDLWYRVNQPQRGIRQRVSIDWLLWPVAAAMVLLICGGTLRTLVVHRNQQSLTDQDMLAMMKSSGGPEFRSESFEETRQWVKTRADIDIDVPSGHTDTPNRGGVRVLGARLIHFHGMPVAVIDYLVGAGVATLFVSSKQAGLRSDTEVTKHLFSDQRRFSWNMRNETYTISYSGAQIPRGACLLCHPAALSGTP